MTVLKRSLLRVTLVALALQAIVPVGYMPSDVDDGWHLTLCPEGVSPQVMTAWMGEHHHHHHHHDVAAAGYGDCDLAGGIAALAQVSFELVLADGQSDSAYLAGRPISHPWPRTFLRPFLRGPPHLLASV